MCAACPSIFLLYPTFVVITGICTFLAHSHILCFGVGVFFVGVGGYYCGWFFPVSFFEDFVLFVMARKSVSVRRRRGGGSVRRKRSATSVVTGSKAGASFSSTAINHGRRHHRTPQELSNANTPPLHRYTSNAEAVRQDLTNAGPRGARMDAAPNVNDLINNCIRHISSLNVTINTQNAHIVRLENELRALTDRVQSIETKSKSFLGL